jgi:hypothetical protein
MIRFISEHRDRFGVELICRVLRPTVQGFLTARGHRAAVGRAPSARQLKDELLVPEVARLHAENYCVYGRVGVVVEQPAPSRRARHAHAAEVEDAYNADQESGQPAPAGQGSR